MVNQEQEEQLQQDQPHQDKHQDEKKSDEHLKYSLKIINRQQPGVGFMTESFVAGTFSTEEEVKDKITQVLNTRKYIKDSDTITFGYIIPGHGFKGKQRALQDDDDITGMYDAYNGKKSPIILWVKIAAVLPRARKCLTEISDNAGSSSKKQKTQKTSEKPPRCTNYQNHLIQMSEVDLIASDLAKKHGEGRYSPEQFRAWANMLQLKKHTSYEVPPNKPYFRNSITKEPQGISPAKRITLRSECIDQHKLMERGAITPDQYKGLQDTIMSDIQKF